MSSPLFPTRVDARRRDRSKTRRTRAIIAALAGATLALASLVAVPAIAASGTSNGIFSDSLRPDNAVDSDRVPVELGVKFSPNESGTVTALQYYQGTGAKKVTSATLWSASGDTLATVSFDATTTEGWRTITLDEPVELTAGKKYVVSYHAPQGGYPVNEDDLISKRTQNGFTLGRGAGVYTYGESSFPTSTYKGSNYLVDIVFAPGETTEATPEAPRPETTAAPTPEETSTPTPTATPTATPTPTPRPTATATPTPPPTTPTATPAPSPTTAPTTPVTGSTTGAGWTITAATVGLAPLGLSCASLPVYTGSSSVPAGTVISGKRITGGLDLSAGNITIDRSCIQPTSAGRGMPVVSTQNYTTFNIAPATVTISNSEFDGSLLSTESAAWATAFIGIANLQSNYIHGFGSGIAIMKSGNTLDARIERNYVTDLVAWGDPATNGNHSDAFTIRDFSAAERSSRQLTVINNRFNADSGSDTGAFFIQTYSGRIDNVLIQGNLLEGNGYQLGLNQLNSPYSNLKAIDNRFTGTGFGATYVQYGPGWAQWSDNYLYSASASNAKGAVVRQP